MNSIESNKGSLWQAQSNLYNTFKGIALGMILAVGLAACGGGSSSSGTPVAAATVPDAPTIGVSTGGDAQAVVNFTAPASNGGSAITGYTVVSNPAGGVDSNAGSLVVSHTITGLTNGTSYTFKVQATNAIGNSADSAASNAVAPVAPTVPGAPTIGTATGSNAQATVHFTAPGSNGGSAITGYTVTSNPAGGTDSNAGSTGLTHTITGLTNGTSYTFTVVATNAKGNSVASGPSNSVTPAAPVGLVTSTASSWALGGTADFNGATSSLVITQPVGGLQANAAEVVVANASQYFGTTFLTIANEEFCTTAKPTITMEIYAPAAGKNIDLKLEQDGNPALNIEMNKTSVAGWHTYTFNCITDSGSATTPPTAPYVEGTVYNKMSVLFNFLAVSAGETWYFDQLTYNPTAAVTYVPPAPAVDPTVLPTAPAVAAGNVISVYGTHYGTMTGPDFVLNPGWGQNTAATEITVLGDSVWKLANLNYQGLNLNPATGIDVSTYTFLHVDVWAASTTALDVFLISPGPTEQAVTLNPTTVGWNSFDIPLSSYTTPVKTNIFQFKFVGTPAGNTVYIDNLYFWK